MRRGQLGEEEEEGAEIHTGRGGGRDTLTMSFLTTKTTSAAISSIAMMASTHPYCKERKCNDKWGRRKRWKRKEHGGGAGDSQ